MALWQFTCAVNTAKTIVPFQGPLRALKRRIAPPQIGLQHESVISGGVDHVRALRAAGLELRGARILEIGTGWFPIIPLMFRIAGAENVFMTDQHRLLDSQTVAAAVRFVTHNRERIIEGLEVGPDSFDSVVGMLDEMLPLDTMLSVLGLTYVAPFVADRQMPDVDAVVSHTVFEHIAPDVLERLLFDIDNGLSPGGLMSHGVDNTDHRSNHDRSLSRFDFLKYSDGVWRLLCLDPQDYTNRLRHVDYVDLILRIGHEIVSERALIDESGLSDLRTASVNERFGGRTPEELAVAWTHLVSRKPGKARAS